MQTPGLDRVFESIDVAQDALVGRIREIADFVREDMPSDVERDFVTPLDVLLGLATPPRGEEAEYARRLESLAGDLPTVFFIGLGVNPPTPSWGSMISEGAQAIKSYPNQAIFPAVALFLIMFAFNFLGDGLRDVLDPKAEGR